MVCDQGMPQSVEFGRTDFRYPAPWSRPSAALRWGAAVVLGCLGLLVQTAGAATVSSEASGYPVRLECGEGTVIFKLRSKPVLTYHGGHGVLPAGVREEYRRAGYLHPLVSPLGRVVTGDYPKNHLHHHGVWASWTRTEIDGRKPDFWNMGEKKGRVEMIQWLGARESADGAEIETLHRYVDLTAKVPTTILLCLWTARGVGHLWADDGSLDLVGVVRSTDGRVLTNANVFVCTAGPRVGAGTLCPSCYADCRKSVRSAGDGHFTIPSVNGLLLFRVLVVAPGF